MGNEKNTPKKTSGGPYAISRRHSERSHGALLLEVRDSLPEILQTTYQTAEPVNEALVEREATYQQRVEALIERRHLKDGQAKLWRQVPRVRFGPPSDIALAKVEFGKSLYRYYDARGNRKPNREALVTCDFRCVFDVPRWSVYLCDDKGSSFPPRPIERPADGLAVRSEMTRVAFYGNIYPIGCALGEISLDMARVVDALAEHTRGADWAVNYLPLIITDDPETYKTFSSQYSILLLSSPKCAWRSTKVDGFNSAHAA